MKNAILVINAGSSSIKFSVFTKTTLEIQMELKGQIEGIGIRPNFLAKDFRGNIMEKKEWSHTAEVHHEFLMKYLIDWLNLTLNDVKLIAAGHRVVHGGTRFSKPVIIDENILGQLEKLIPLAPLHQPHNLAAIRALGKVFPSLPQVACFDTAFHSTDPEVFQHFFIPRELEEEGVRRYGFHGLSYQYIAETLNHLAPEVAKKKVIVAHLGSGASMCALENGKSLATSMGMTALDGLPMGTRPGNLDAGVVLYLMREKKMNADQIENLLYKKSGLLGLSGINNDMRVLEESKDPRALETIEAFVWKIAQTAGGLVALLRGLDGFVFTAGIGENSQMIREKVCEKLTWLGIEFDSEANQKAGPVRISKANSKVSVWVIPTNEELMIAEQTALAVKAV